MFFKALRRGRGISRENELTFKIILALGVRKMELCAAEWSEFDLDNEVWHLLARGQRMVMTSISRCRRQ